MAKSSIKENKNPWIAGILNFFLPGLGYLYAGRKKLFVSLGFFVLTIIVTVYEWDDIIGIFSGKVSADFMLYIIAYPIVFAYDGYVDATGVNKYQNK